MKHYERKTLGIPEWQRLCFDTELVINGIRGGCGEPDCNTRNKGCKIRALVKTGHLGEVTAKSGGGTFIQNTCGFPDILVFSQNKSVTKEEARAVKC